MEDEELIEMLNELTEGAAKHGTELVMAAGSGPTDDEDYDQIGFITQGMDGRVHVREFIVPREFVTNIDYTNQEEDNE